MPVYQAKCPKCGFVVNIMGVGKRAKYKTDVAEWGKECQHIQEAQGVPDQCPALRLAMNRPTTT